MTRWYSKKRKNKTSKVIKQGGWIKFCGCEWWYGRFFICSHKDGMCYDCAKELDPYL